LIPARRVVFTYGWERTDVEIPPGSTTVEIDLTATRETTTLLRLVHRGLDDLAAGAHHGGRTHYLDRLRRRAEGSTRFWDLAQPLLGRPGVTRSTMMGLHCLRWNGTSSPPATAHRRRARQACRIRPR
jgi:hypothetical protein